MSGLLFLGAVGGFVMIAYWAFQNDAMRPDECGSGLLAMQLPSAATAKSVPKWKKISLTQGPRRASRAETVTGKPNWKRTLLYGSVR